MVIKMDAKVTRSRGLQKRTTINHNIKTKSGGFVRRGLAPPLQIDHYHRVQSFYTNMPPCLHPACDSQQHLSSNVVLCMNLTGGNPANAPRRSSDSSAPRTAPRPPSRPSTIVCMCLSGGCSLPAEHLLVLALTDSSSQR